MPSDPPVIGACLPVHRLADFRDWLFEADRDVELQSFETAEVLDGDWRALAGEARRLLDGHEGRRGIHGPFRGFAIDAPDPEIRRLVERRLMQGLDVCAAVGADHMVIHSPYTAWDHANFGDQHGARARIVEDVHATLAAVVRRAEAQGVTLVVENVADVDPGERRRLVESFGSERVKLSLDTGHAQYAHASCGAPPVDYFVEDAGAALAHVHLQDADGHADRHWPIGEGTIRWEPVFRALARRAERPRLLLELRDPDGIPAAMETLRGRGLGR
jgi:sugar phosphate isomerase/epimerase